MLKLLNMVFLWYSDILIDLFESVLDLIKANSAVQQNACIGVWTTLFDTW